MWQIFTGAGFRNSSVLAPGNPSEIADETQGSQTKALPELGPAPIKAAEKTGAKPTRSAEGSLKAPSPRNSWRDPEPLTAAANPAGCSQHLWWDLQRILRTCRNFKGPQSLQQPLIPRKYPSLRSGGHWGDDSIATGVTPGCLEERTNREAKRCARRWWTVCASPPVQSRYRDWLCGKRCK